MEISTEKRSEHRFKTPNRSRPRRGRWILDLDQSTQKSTPKKQTMKRNLRYSRTSRNVLGSICLLLMAKTTGFTLSGRKFRDSGMTSLQGELQQSERSATNDGTPREKVSGIFEELTQLSETTNRGFQASAEDRRRARDRIFSLEKLNTSPEPAADYYSNNKSDTSDAPTISGKWTLIYTDAPDIIALDTSRYPFSTAKLGRIGQECSPPFVKNVIEWMRPDWASQIPYAGSTDTRILQKVVTSASATPDKPFIVDLKVAGFELSSPKNVSTTENLSNRIQTDGFIAGLLTSNPVDLKGPWNPPFGKFRVLYLDEQYRATLTSQNHVAVNRRCTSEEECSRYRLYCDVKVSQSLENNSDGRASAQQETPLSKAYTLGKVLELDTRLGNWMIMIREQANSWGGAVHEKLDLQRISLQRPQDS
eukprot:scaffold894_cov153-Cylindrotheca_fusiformis.AAC.6